MRLLVSWSLRRPWRGTAEWDRLAQKGQAIVWVAVMLPLFLSVVGLATDGGMVLAARRDLQNVADASARAGAMQIDLQVYRQTAGATVALDESAARSAAAAYLGDQASGLTGTVSTDPQRVVVQVSREAPLGFLRILGLSTMRVTARATAGARFGIAGAGGP